MRFSSQYLVSNCLRVLHGSTVHLMLSQFNLGSSKKALTDLKIKRAAPQLKSTWLTDEKGLRLLIKPNGSKYWRLNYRFSGKQKTLALGVYLEVSLKMARELRDEAKG